LPCSPSLFHLSKAMITCTLSFISPRLDPTCTGPMHQDVVEATPAGRAAAGRRHCRARRGRRPGRRPVRDSRPGVQRGTAVRMPYRRLLCFRRPPLAPKSLCFQPAYYYMILAILFKSITPTHY
jgi:hypothetical protein